MQLVLWTDVGNATLGGAVARLEATERSQGQREQGIQKAYGMGKSGDDSQYCMYFRFILWAEVALMQFTLSDNSLSICLW